MRGYFTRLAKQSGAAIGAGNPSARARPGPLPRVPPDGAGAPLHVETVAWANSLTPAEDVGLQSRAGERSTRNQDASEGARRPTRNDPNISSESDSNKQIGELSETSFFRLGSTRSRASEGQPEVAGSTSEALEKQASGKGGVVRVGERGSSSEQKPAPEPDSFTEVALAIARQEASIPRDYLADIREWLSSPPVTSEAIESRSAAHRSPEKMSTAQEQADRSLHSNFVDRDSAPQHDIQEFSLSIGSISIVVEEPAQPPKQRSNSVQPVESASVSAQPGARDAFALSRSYFRGF